MKNAFVVMCLVVSFCVSAQLPAFNPAQQPAAPDYSLEKNWSALPFRKDEADKIPKWETWVSDSLKEVDVFYIYPTLYMKGKTWNADVEDKKLNRRIDTKPVRYQASVFNASCRVYAPRYRQSIIDVFYDSTSNGKNSLAFAYDDVKRAFEYYLKHYNAGRPFIIASHSQGTYHARRLLKEMLDGTELSKRMVAAYAIGFALYDTMYTVLKPCENATQTGCFITWASYKKGYEPQSADRQLAGNICINPVTWSRDTMPVEVYFSKGTLLLDFSKRYEKACRTQIHNNVLWVENHLPIVGSMNNLHIADYNLFWFDIRDNVAQRVKEYLKKTRQ
jgi:hypothetical protein